MLPEEPPLSLFNPSLLAEAGNCRSEAGFSAAFPPALRILASKSFRESKTGAGLGAPEGRGKVTGWVVATGGNGGAAGAIGGAAGTGGGAGTLVGAGGIKFSSTAGGLAAAVGCDTVIDGGEIRLVGGAGGGLRT